MGRLNVRYPNVKAAVKPGWSARRGCAAEELNLGVQGEVPVAESLRPASSPFRTPSRGT